MRLRTSRHLVADVLWLLGYPSQALQRSHEALTLAQELSHSYSLVLAINYEAIMHQFRREGRVAQERTEVAIAMATEHGYGQFLAAGTFLHGWALAEQGQGEEGIALMRQGLDALQAIGVEVNRPRYLVQLAEAYGKVGQVKEGLTSVSEALSIIERTEERDFESELHRIKGVLLLDSHPDNDAESETCFKQALDVARQQQAKSWELRAATSLARLWQSQDKCQDAYDLLAPVYEWFTEGFDTVLAVCECGGKPLI